MRFVTLRSLLFLCLIGLVACSGDGPLTSQAQTAPAASDAGTSAPKHWAAFLVAGDTAAPVFDHAVDSFSRQLSGPTFTTVHRFSADDSKVAAADLATVDNLTAAMTTTMAASPADDGCLFFITSHGGHDGAVLKADDAYLQRLSPVRLGTILDASCGKRPTVVIVSACFSGIFLDVAAPNRVILTAARADRTSFGCGAGFAYTYYDECLLKYWPTAPDFPQLYESMLGCLSEKERQMNVQPSLPQASFGAEVAHLPLPR